LEVVDANRRSASIAFEAVNKIYPDGTHALADFTLDVADGEFLVFVGPSGCGKTTAMLMVAGLEDISSGEIRIGGEVVNDLEPRDRDVAMVFQNYALYPHMTVYQNLAFGLQMKKVKKTEIERRVKDIAAILGLDQLLGRKPRHLSGGQRQRVAMGRAIVRDPRVFLMDEPLSNLDAKLRVQMRAEISRVQRQLGATTIYVTHDQVEAMTMGDRVAVLRRGRLQQLGTPHEVYERPVNLFVAGFIGSPEMNLLVGSLENDGVRVGEQRLHLPPMVFDRRPALRGFIGGNLGVGIRPEHLLDARGMQQAAGSSISGILQLTEVLGSELLVHVEVEAARLEAAELLEVARDVDVTVADELQSDVRRRVTTIVGRLSTRSQFDRDAPVSLYVEPEHLHFFDPETGLAIYGSEQQ
jgi:multiple sugar transport system ATP-binding protein